jgi:hypothetical protein
VSVADAGKSDTHTDSNGYTWYSNAYAHTYSQPNSYSQPNGNCAW